MALEMSGARAENAPMALQVFHSYFGFWSRDIEADGKYPGSRLASFTSRADGKRYVVFTCAEISPEFRQLDYYSTAILRASDTKSGIFKRAVLVDDREGKIHTLFRGSTQAAREVHNRVINALFKYSEAEWRAHIPDHLPVELTPDMKRLLGRERPDQEAIFRNGDDRQNEVSPSTPAKLTDSELERLAELDFRNRISKQSGKCP